MLCLSFTESCQASKPGPPEDQNKGCSDRYRINGEDPERENGGSSSEDQLLSG